MPATNFIFFLLFKICFKCPFFFFAFWTKIQKCSNIFVEGSNIFVSDFNNHTKTIKTLLHSRKHLHCTKFWHPRPGSQPTSEGKSAPDVSLCGSSWSSRYSWRIHLLSRVPVRQMSILLHCPVHPSFLGITSRQDPISTIKSAEPVS